MNKDYMIKLNEFWYGECKSETKYSKKFIKEAILTEQIIKAVETYYYDLNKCQKNNPLSPEDEYHCNTSLYKIILKSFETVIKELTTAFINLSYDDFIKMMNEYEDNCEDYPIECTYTECHDTISTLFDNFLTIDDVLLLLLSFKEVMYGSIYDMESLIMHSNRLYRLVQKAYKNILEINSLND